MNISNLVFEAELRNITPVTQSQIKTVTMSPPSPVLSSANSYSINSESFIQSPSSEHYYPHIEENLQPIPHYSKDTERTTNSNSQDISDLLVL